jgi:hypothetical protein
MPWLRSPNNRHKPIPSRFTGIHNAWGTVTIAIDRRPAPKGPDHKN